MKKTLDNQQLNTVWVAIETHGYPPKDKDPFYQNRYSVPVLAGNEITGQVAILAYIWDYEQEGWLHSIMDEGTDPGDYEVQHVSHWALWPECK